MDQLRLRIYNVLFGDAILMSVPDIDEQGHKVVLHVLIDCGNALAGAAGDDAVFKPVLEDIRSELGGAPLDLYVMTHEHMDHVQGMLYGKSKLGIEIKAKQVWMTASSAPDYYQRFTKAREQKSLAMALYQSAERFLAASGGGVPAGLAALMAINNPRASKDCVYHIASLSTAPPLYVHRTADISARNPFRKTKIRILAPEEDTSVYYGRFGPNTLGLGLDGADALAPASTASRPPPGVSAGDFFDLVRFRLSGMLGNLLQIDKAANNSSVVIELEWEGWRLLLPGDAEERSWAIMEKLGLLKSAHFLKVSHHGSINGSPSQVTDMVLPATAPDGRPRKAVVSTAVGAYSGVPDPQTLETLSKRAELHDTRTLQPGQWFDITFEAP